MYKPHRTHEIGAGFLACQSKIEMSGSLQIEQRGAPRTIQLDNGAEFTSNHFDASAYCSGTDVDFIRPGKPVDNSPSSRSTVAFGASAQTASRELSSRVHHRSRIGLSGLSGSGGELAVAAIRVSCHGRSISSSAQGRSRPNLPKLGLRLTLRWGSPAGPGPIPRNSQNRLLNQSLTGVQFGFVFIEFQWIWTRSCVVKWRAPRIHTNR